MDVFRSAAVQITFFFSNKKVNVKHSLRCLVCHMSLYGCISHGASQVAETSHYFYSIIMLSVNFYYSVFFLISHILGFWSAIANSYKSAGISETLSSNVTV